jgi:glucose-6-phosphate-specific signal transduction histidine kinase
MQQAQRHSFRGAADLDRLWVEVAIVIGVTALTLLISIRLQINEAFYALSRHWEWFQADELPLAMLSLSIGLIWLAWRRYRTASVELAARRIAEAQLARVLEENRTLARENVRIQESERKHLARELHDELGQYLNAIKLDAVAVRDSPALDEPSRRSAVAIVRAVDHVHTVVSGMIARLRPVGLDELGLTAALENCVHHWRERHPGTEVRLALRGEFEGLEESLSLTVYRLVQEGLTNIDKHARAGHVEIVLERVGAAQESAERLALTVADDGCGMDPDAPTGRFGLRGMRERVEMAGGTFELVSALNEGTRLRATLPVSQACA